MERRRHKTDYGHCAWVSPPEPDGLIRCWEPGTTIISLDGLVACDMHWPSLGKQDRVDACEERLVRWLQSFDAGHLVRVYDFKSSPSGRLTIGNICQGFVPSGGLFVHDGVLEKESQRCGELATHRSPEGLMLCRRVHGVGAPARHLAVPPRPQIRRQPECDWWPESPPRPRRSDDLEIDENGDIKFVPIDYSEAERKIMESLADAKGLDLDEIARVFQLPREMLGEKK